MKMAVCVLIAGMVGGACGFLISVMLLIPFRIVLFLGGDPISSLAPIRWAIDREYLFLVWYVAATAAGGLLGAVACYRFGAGRWETTGEL